MANNLSNAFVPRYFLGVAVQRCQKNHGSERLAPTEFLFAIYGEGTGLLSQLKIVLPYIGLYKKPKPQIGV